MHRENEMLIARNIFEKFGGRFILPLMNLGFSGTFLLIVSELFVRLQEPGA